MKNFGPSSVSEFLEDRIVYRNLVPMDSRLPPLATLRARLGLPEVGIPRKSQPAYGRVIAHLLRAARQLDAPGTALRQLVYVGDTRMNDGTAFANICRAGAWPGLAFIAAEKEGPPQVEVVEQEAGTLYLANRWAALADFDRYCRAHGFPLDERTAVVVDLDKTALGARGRNDHVIDQARVVAVRRTVGELLGEAFDPALFEIAYQRLNQPEFHPFTADNQDYLAYICLIVGSGLYQLEPLVTEVQAGRLTTFAAFIGRVDERSRELSADLRAIHEQVFDRVQRGDPTPFKSFRYNEYRATLERMGFMPDNAPVDQLLAQEIVVTQEVREMALAWRERGALLFGLSDKPDEASVPRAELAAQGYRPIHRAKTHAVGE